MRRLIVVVLSVALAGCSLAPQISNYTVSYNGSIEEVNNQLLIANVLRARDRAPLYFSDLSQIRGALTVEAGATLSAPFGQGKITTTKHFVAGASALFETQPTFDIVPLNEQEFTQGIMQPFELQYGKLYWDRLDYPEFLLTMLFVDRIEIRFYENRALVPLLTPDGNVAMEDGKPTTEKVRAYLNLPEDNTPEEKQLRANFLNEIALWEVRPENPRTQRSVSYHAYTEYTPIGEDVALGNQGGLKDFLGLDPRKFLARRVHQGAPNDEAGKPARSAKDEDRYQLYAVENRIIICPPKSFRDRFNKFNITIVAPQIEAGTVNVTPQSAGACDASTWPPDGTQQTKPEMEITVYTRSVEGMIQYLGGIQRATELPSGDVAHDNPLGFFIRPGLLKGRKVALDYQGEDYSVLPYRPDETLGTDNTLPILALVEQLLNLRKNSKEITTTPAAEIVP